jgi:hypothetical protein
MARVESTLAALAKVRLSTSILNRSRELQQRMAAREKKSLQHGRAALHQPKQRAKSILFLPKDYPTEAAAHYAH